MENVDQDPHRRRRAARSRCARGWVSKPARRGTPRCWSKARRRAARGRLRPDPAVADDDHLSGGGGSPRPTRSTVSSSRTPACRARRSRSAASASCSTTSASSATSGWRQNEQTFDALRVVNRSVANLVLDATYFDRVNRVYGPDSPQGHYKGDSFLLNAGYQTKVGKISAFGYLLDFERTSPRCRPRCAIPRRRTGCASRAKSRWARSSSPTARRTPPRPTTPTIRSTSISTTWPASSPARSASSASASGTEILEGNGVQGVHHAARDAAQVPGLGRQVPGHAAERHRRPYVNAGVDAQGRGRARYAGISSELPRLRGGSASAPTTGTSGTCRSPRSTSASNLMLKYADYQPGRARGRAQHQQAVGAARIRLVTRLRFFKGRRS